MDTELIAKEQASSEVISLLRRLYQEEKQVNKLKEYRRNAIATPTTPATRITQAKGEQELGRE